MKLISQSNDELRAKLDNYLANDEFFRNVFAYTQNRFNAATQLTAHNWEHAYRDTINAIVVGEAENADMSIVLPAATMHDIGFIYGAKGRDHGPVGAERLLDFLTDGDIRCEQGKLDAIAGCIRTHKGKSHDMEPESLEAKVVADADLLEKFGPFGVYQNIRTMTEFNRNFEESTERFTSMRNVELFTETGKKLAEPGRQFVIDFFTELLEAAEPYGQIE